MHQEERDWTKASTGPGGLMTREVTVGECDWLPRNIQKGEVVFKSFEPDYGCCSPNGIMVHLEAEKFPAYEVPIDSVMFV